MPNLWRIGGYTSWELSPYLALKAVRSGLQAGNPHAHVALKQRIVHWYAPKYRRQQR